jgi:hypothetical protein
MSEFHEALKTEIIKRTVVINGVSYVPASMAYDFAQVVTDLDQDLSDQKKFATLQNSGVQ